MAWLDKLFQTYERCCGHEPDGSVRLMPVAHTTQLAHVEIAIDGEGNFRRAKVLDKPEALTLIACTEGSGGRSGSRPVHHPLCDKLQYLAADFAAFGGEVTSGYAGNPAEPFQNFLTDLAAWAASDHDHPKVKAVLAYVRQGHVVADLVNAGVLHVGADGHLLHAWGREKADVPRIFKVLAPGQSQEDAFVRWRIEFLAEPDSTTWDDASLIQAWISRYAQTQSSLGLCQVTGTRRVLATQHPAKLRHGGDKAKLISANDGSGFTYRGRFIEANQAAGVGFEVTHKAHNALRWLIERQGARVGDGVVVAWAVSGSELPGLVCDSDEFLSLCDESTVLPEVLDSQRVESAGQEFGRRLKSAIEGYKARLDDAGGVVVMGIDSATPGRMAITFYRQLQGSELLNRIQDWHTQLAWPQNFGKQRRFVGAPSPRDIAAAAYGRQLDTKLEKAACERLLPCIVDGQTLPIDLMRCAVHRASHRIGLGRRQDNWEWEKCLGIACALVRGLFKERNYAMTLERERSTRDYLYGRLLAIADRLEGAALKQADETRATNAARLMQRFAERPASTWRTIELSLQPYRARLRNHERGAGTLVRCDRELGAVCGQFTANDFANDSPLEPEFLLGFHCQRQALWESAKKEATSEPQPDNQTSGS